MKAYIAIVLTIASVSALGSGPYLPSGWRPDGPAFFLPSEIQKSTDVVVNEAVQETVASGSDTLQEYGPPKLEVTINESVQETEASGSDSLREYGPPEVQEVSQDVANQGLPDVITEQTFAEVKAAVEEVGVNEASAVEFEKVETVANIEQRTVEELTLSALTEEATTTAALEEETQTDQKVTEPSIVSEDVTTENALLEESTEAVFEGRSLDVGIRVDEAEKIVEVSEVQTTETEEAAKIVEEVQEVVETTAAYLEERVEKVEEAVQMEVKAVDESVKNIEETLVNLENEIKSEQVQSEIQIKTSQENSGSLAVPEGFLEYGPPGFREYGPPKDDLLRSAAQVTANDVSEPNEARKRRFSPKFRTSKSQPKRSH